MDSLPLDNRREISSGDLLGIGPAQAEILAFLMELVYMLGLEPSAERIGGSNPPEGTRLI